MVPEIVPNEEGRKNFWRDLREGERVLEDEKGGTEGSVFEKSRTEGFEFTFKRLLEEMGKLLKWKNVSNISITRVG